MSGGDDLMANLDIIQPVAVLALFTLAILLLMGLRRLKAQLAGQVTEGDFKFGESARVPPEVGILNRNYMNLLELPMLFYVGSLMILVTGQTDKTYLWLAWAYVALRLVHSAIHLTYNRVLHRLFAFAASNAVLVIMWIRILFLTRT